MKAGVGVNSVRCGLGMHQSSLYPPCTLFRSYRGNIAPSPGMAEGRDRPACTSDPLIPFIPTLIVSWDVLLAVVTQDMDVTACGHTGAALAQPGEGFPPQ